MNKSFFSALFVFLMISAYSQTVTVLKEKEKVKGESIEVYVLTLDGKKDEISSAWNKFLKDIGKLKQSTDPMTVSEPVISGTTYSSNVFYADFEKNNETSYTVWAGINPAEWNEAEIGRVNRELEKLVYKFGVNFYRQKVQVQIDETQQALDAVEKQKQRTLNQNKDLTLKLSNNDQEKIQLEKSLENNKFEHAALKIKLENNKKAQDSLANVSIQIKKVMETHKDKQSKIN